MYHRTIHPPLSSSNSTTNTHIEIKTHFNPEHYLAHPLMICQTQSMNSTKSQAEEADEAKTCQIPNGIVLTKILTILFISYANKKLPSLSSSTVSQFIKTKTELQKPSCITTHLNKFVSPFTCVLSYDNIIYSIYTSFNHFNFCVSILCLVAEIYINIYL